MTVPSAARAMDADDRTAPMLSGPRVRPSTSEVAWAVTLPSAAARTDASECKALTEPKAELRSPAVASACEERSSLRAVSS